MVELRKRKTPPPAPEKPARKAKVTKDKSGEPAPKKIEEPKAKTSVVMDTEEGTSKPVTKSAFTELGKKSASGAPPQVNETVDLDGFGGTITTHEGKSVTLKELVEKSKSGVVLFTYPKASTPGCTTQVCAFRDDYANLTSGGLDIYGLSGDSPKANTTFFAKHSLPYPLLCDPDFNLIGAIGMRKSASEKKTSRGVFVIDKSGKVLITQQAGPLPTVAAVQALVKS